MNVWSMLAVGMLVPSLALAAGNITITRHETKKREITDIRGDAAATEVSLARGETADEIVVTGSNGTTLNGADAPVVITDVSDVRVRLAGGRDVLTVERGVLVPAKLDVDLGPGNDVIYVAGGSYGSLYIDGDSGVDEIAVTSVTTDGLLRIDGEEDDDNISVTSSLVGGTCYFDGGRGDDTWLIDALFGQYVRLDTDEGVDAVLIERSQLSGKLSVDLGRRDDEIILHAVVVDGLVTLDGGGDVDTYVDVGDNTFRGGLELKRIEIVK